MGSGILRFTPLYGGILVLIVMYLAFRVVGYRRKEKVGLDANKCSEAMTRAVRAHANAVEYIPLAILMMVMLELNHLNPILMHAFGCTMVVARILHGYGLSNHSAYSFGRFYGTLLTWICLLLMAILNIYLTFIM